MGYTVIDIIERSIEIEFKRKEILTNIGIDNKNLQQIIIMSKVLTKDIDANIKSYEYLKEKMIGEKFDRINYEIYDTISALIIEFSNKKYMAKTDSVKEYLEFSIDLDRDTYSLFVDIQGRLVKSIDDVNTQTYKLLSKIIYHMGERILDTEKTLDRIVLE